ncbi:hypothetical protein [Paludisphaera rhizosphaerae]|uniref:hypothetical protein n=1 Tax=Paludisphaera rhizosphaerae TaxID=2711216 RepID=UPI0013EC2504|nr:hypothetical protein [Paludisphaera rhizosphaerae]
MSARIRFVIALWVMTATGSFAFAQQPPSPPPSPAGAEKPPRRWPKEVVVLEGAADAAEFWKKLDAPDWIVARPAAGRAEAGTAVEVAPIIDAVHVKGTVEGEDARVELAIDCTLVAEGPVWVPLKIDVPVVLSAREGDREVRLQRRVEGGSWEAWLEGVGSHRLRIRATVPIRVGAERRTLELAIPEAPATSFDLILPRRSIDVDLGRGEPPVAPSAVEGGEGVRVAAHVRPHSPLVVSWNEEAGGPRAAPLLSAQIEMAVDVDSEGVAVRSSWAISCARGIARSLQIRLHDDETVTRLQLNEQYPTPSVDHAGGGNLLTIPLAEPMRPGEPSRRLVLETRRPTIGSKVLDLSGYPLADAGEQTGFIGATHGPNLFVNVLKSQGVRRIDPRDLPTALKGKPGTTLALQFLEQPFALSLGVEESPPLYRADVSARLFLEPDGVRNDTTLEIRWVRGSLFEIDVAVPPDLKVVSVGPPELVETVTPPQPSTAAGEERVLRVRLTPQARDRRPFVLKLTGRQPAPTPGDVRLGLFAPRGAVATTAVYAVNAGREVALEPVDESLVRDTAAESPPAQTDAAGTPTLSLRSGRNPTTLDLRLERRTREVRRETRLFARVSRRGVELRQETHLRVRHGAVAALDVVVPAGVSSRWEASDGQKPIRTEDLDGPVDGPRRSRLLLDRPIVDSATLTFQFRLPFARPLDDSSPTALKIPWLTVEPGQPGPCLVELAIDPDVEVVVADPAWTKQDETPEVRAFRLERDDADDGLAASARMVEAVPLPLVVAPRAFIRSSLDAGGDLRVRAWYAVESHPATLTVALPSGARWLRARIDGRAVDRIDAGGDGATSRIDLPSDAVSRPVLLDLEYHAPAAAVGRSWAPPALLDGAEVLQTYWLAEFPSGFVAAGPPRGWADENRWGWDLYSWTRRPVAGAAKLAAWAAGPSPPPGVLDDALDADDAVRGVLFSRTGPPTPLSLWVVSRLWALIGGSTLSLLAVLGLAYFPKAAPWIVGGAVAAGLAAVLLLPFAAPALAVQVVAIGLGMGLLALRLRPRESRETTAPTSGRTGSTSGVAVDSSRRSSLGVGSDESTAIRVRTTSTTDYLTLPPAPERDADAPVSSRRESGLRTD